MSPTCKCCHSSSTNYPLANRRVFLSLICLSFLYLFCIIVFLHSLHTLLLSGLCLSRIQMAQWLLSGSVSWLLWWIVGWLKLNIQSWQAWRTGVWWPWEGNYTRCTLLFPLHYLRTIDYFISGCKQFGVHARSYQIKFPFLYYN